MAEEASNGALDVAPEDQGSSKKRRRRPSVVDVALAHAELLSSGEPLLVASDDIDTLSYNLTTVGNTERIVIDLRDEVAAPVIELEFTSLREVADDTAVIDDIVVADVVQSDATVIDLRPGIESVGIEPFQATANLSEIVELPPSLDAIGQGLDAASAAALFAKRAVDVVLAAIALVVLLPFLAIIAVLVAVTTPGPVLYRSERVGKDGQVFSFLKFRSMFIDAPARLEELRDHNEQTGPVFKMENDPRITPIGKFLRRGSIDELPQLLHVLSGRMSIVGPRPALVAEVEQYSDVERQRLLVKPGITCIWQVSGRSTIDFDTWVAMDLEYIRCWSLAKDVSLMAQTVPAVLSGKGAY